MKFYTREKDKILIRGYEAKNDKLYEYKKNELNKYSDNVLSTYVTPSQFYTRDDLKNGYIELHQIDGDIDVFGLSTRDNEIIEKYCSGEITKEQLFIEFGRNINLISIEDITKEKQSELLERYCKGEILEYKLQNNKIIPNKLHVSGIKSWGYGDKLIVANGIIKLNPQLLLLERLESGNIYFDEKELSEIDEQLECFNFSDEILDEVNISTLELLVNNHIYNNNLGYEHLIKDSIIGIRKNAEKGTKLLNKALKR